MKSVIWLICSVFLLTAGVNAQPRPVAASTTTVVRAAAPSTFEAKYEGGMFGFNEREVGMLKLDDDNQRLVFFGKNKKESFGIPYRSLLVLSPSSKSVTSTTGNVVKNIPLPGAALGGLIKEKKRYLVVQFDDPDVDAKGVINFKIDDKELLESVIQTLGKKANLAPRGDAYYRSRVQRTDF